MSGPAVATFADDATVRGLLAGTRPFVVGRRDASFAVPVEWNAVAVRSFTSFAALSIACESGPLEPGIGALLYDCEAWRFTPDEEQRDVGEFTQKAARLAHDRGLLLIAAPAVDLTRVLAPGPERRYDAFLRLQIPAASARSADAFVIQAQGSLMRLPLFTKFVRDAARAARAANPRVLVFAGVSTNPSGQRVSAEDVARAIGATRALVDGYWMNVPQRSAYAPKVNDYRPDIAIEVFKRLATGPP